MIEAWNEDREINKRIVGDTIKALVVIGGAIAIGYAGKLIPGATHERLALFEAYHFYSVFSLCVYFTLLLVAEITLLFFNRLKRLGS